MPSPTLSEALKEAYASAPDEVIILHTLEIRHSSFFDENGDPMAVRVVRDNEDLTATLEDDAPMNAGETVEFIALHFDLSLPAQDDTGATPEIQFSIANVGRVLMRYIDDAVVSKDPVYITYRPYLSTDLTQPHMNPPITLTVRSISANLNEVTGRAGFGDTPNRRFPRVDYTSRDFPGLSAR